MNNEPGANISVTTTDHALAGRLPVLFRSRVYASYPRLLLTYTAIAAASYSYLVGAALIGVGNTRVGIVGYLIGLVVGMAFVSLAGGALSYRYGVDTVDAGKAALGMRGGVTLLVGVLVCTLGWANVLLAMTARGAVRVVHGFDGIQTPVRETEVSVIGLLLLGAIWLFVRRGAGSMERVANCCAAVQLVIAAILFIAVLVRYGFAKAWSVDVPEAHAYSTDGLTQLSYAVEFGICNALGMLPYMGGLSRLVRNPRHLVGPPVIGYAVCGAFLIAVIGALATASTGDVDPADWIPQVVGTRAGLALFGAMLVANVGALVTQVYLAGISIQQIRAFARLPWNLVVALVLTPSIVVAFNSRWVIDHVMNWLAYNGVMFVGLGSVLFVDFFMLRRQRIEIDQLFAAGRDQLYWFRGGVNWIAVVVIVAATCGYLWLFDPASLQASALFRYAGAAVPIIVGSSVAYFLLMKWFIASRRLNGYREGERAAVSVPVTL